MTTTLQPTKDREPASITAIRDRRNAARVARYSRSDTYVNDQIIQFIQRNCPRGDGSITDATACIGGDAIPFAHRFSHVLCIEKDLHQFEQLVLNFSKTNLQAGVDYRCVHADALQEVPRRRHNIIYVDTPWGGVDYTKWGDDTLHLYMNDLLVEEVCILWADFTDRIVLKVPYNFAHNAFRTRIMNSGRFSHVRTHMIRRPRGNPVGVICICVSNPSE